MKTIFNFARSRSMPLILALLMLVYGTGCQTTFRVQTATPQRINLLRVISEKHFIVHQGVLFYELFKPEVKDGVLNGVLSYPDLPVYYSVNRSNRFTKTEASIVNEVHIFLNEKAPELLFGQITIPVQNIAEVQIIKKSNKAEGVVILVGAVALMLFISGAAALEGLNAEWHKPL